MATSVIEICNNALQGLKAKRIMSLADGSEEAALCDQIWPSVRDSVLASHPWNGAMRLAVLAASATAPAWKWTTAYPLPADCLRVFEVESSAGVSIGDWEMQGREILCDETDPVYISYVKQETDPTRYDPLLSKAMSYALAAELAYPLTASVTAQQGAWTLYQNVLREARGVDARQGSSTEAITVSNWTLAKLGGRYLG